MQRMRRVALISVGACAIVALMTSSAFALPELLPGGKGTKFTGKAGKGLLQIKGGAAVACTSMTGEGELTGPTTGKGTINFKGCSSLGLAINTLGDASGTVLISGETSICYINKAAKTVGVVTHIPEAGVHVEVPSVKLLLLKKGNFIIQATPVNESTTMFNGILQQKEGKQAITKCEQEDVLTFEKAQELMA